MRRRILISDYDGTLAPFRIERLKTELYDGTELLLQQLYERGDRLVFVTGRITRELEKVFPFSKNVEVWGCHGFERRKPGGDVEYYKLGDEAERSIRAAYRWGKREGIEKLLELKHGALTLHLRGLDSEEAERILEKASSTWKSLCIGMKCQVRTSDGGIELRAESRDKSSAVDDILSEESGEYAAAYMGDDETDEDAFREIAKHGLGILVRPEWRETLAKVWLKPPLELNRFLKEWISRD